MRKLALNYARYSGKHPSHKMQPYCMLKLWGSFCVGIELLKRIEYDFNIS
jgi:hypothetical protein